MHTLENIEQPKKKALNNLDLTKGKRGLLPTAVRAKDKEKWDAPSPGQTPKV